MNIALKLVRMHVLPSLIQEISAIGCAIDSLQDADVSDESLREDLVNLERSYSKIKVNEQKLKKEVAATEKIEDSYLKAERLSTKGTEVFNQLRSAVDLAEEQVSYDNWSLPRYDQLLLSIG